MIMANDRRKFDSTVPVIIIGAGGCGLTAALAARAAGADVLIIERDATPSGSTGMSTGLIPAAGTPEQAAEGILDGGAQFAVDILAKAGSADPAIVRRIADESAETIAMLQECGVPLTLLGGFTYSGHSVRRMFGTPNRTGCELIAALLGAVETADAMIMTSATVRTLFVAEDQRITGVGVERPDGTSEEIGCGALILASSGFGGNAALVKSLIPEIASAPYHGHPGNRGDALIWGQALGAGVGDIDAYQGHGNLAAGHGIILNWPSIIEGGFQVSTLGRRFYDESIGYSAAAAHVQAQPGHLAWTIFDARIAAILEQFGDFHDAVSAGAVIAADDLASLAARTRLPAAALNQACQSVEAFCSGLATDPFGRDFRGLQPPAPPYRAVRVTGALLHTQGGLTIDRDARVLTMDGRAMPNLFAGGGAARGISGAGSRGYIAGNGLVTATTLGKIAGRAAAALVMR